MKWREIFYIPTPFTYDIKEDTAGCVGLYWHDNHMKVVHVISPAGFV
jgi:hypothetical protein